MYFLTTGLSHALSVRLCVRQCTFGFHFQIFTSKFDISRKVKGAIVRQPSCYGKPNPVDCIYMYIPRFLEQAVLRIHATFKVLYVGGPRQVGKTTMLRHLAQEEGVRMITLDDPDLLLQARSDPGGLLDAHPSPLCIDEVQYAPELFPEIKRRVDVRERYGQYWLSGSQQFALMEGLQESLAGRVGIIDLLGFSSAEIAHTAMRKQPFLPMRSVVAPSEQSPQAIFARIWRGSFPRRHTAPHVDPKDFYDSYIRTYIDRDVRRFHGIQKSTEFHRFLQLCAARTGQVLNIADLARDADVSPHAAREWLAILEQTMQIYLLRPYFTSRSKRLVKAPKLYFLDTGLAAHLTHWLSPEQLQAGAMSGAFFETHVVTEILKSYLFRGRQPPLWFFRDHLGHEVDLLIEEGQSLFPIEIKQTRTVRKRDLRGILFFRAQQRAAAHAAVITPQGPSRPFDRDTTILPVSAIA